MSQLDQLVNQPNLYMNGLLLSNDGTTPNTKLDVAAGQCRDSNNLIDINVGNYLGLSGIGTANSSTVINFSVNGANGLDTGSIDASSFYYIFAIADSSGKNVPAAIASLSASAPTLPLGYDSIRCIGCCLTDGSSHILKYLPANNSSNLRYFQWDAPIAVTVTDSGTSATYSAMDLSVGVPVSFFGRVAIKYKWTNNAPADALNFTPSGNSGDYFTDLGIAAGVAQENSFIILPRVSSSLPKLSYKISAGTLNNVWVQAFEMQL